MIQTIQSISRLFHRRRPTILARCGGLRGESGGALAEVAFIVAILVPPLLLGVADMATVLYFSIEVSTAAHAGAMYGMQNSVLAVDTTHITTAAKAEAHDFAAANVTVTPTTYWVCNTAQGGTTYATSAAATSPCTSASAYPLEFVKVVVSAPVSPPFHCCGIPATITLSNASVMEVQGQQ
jgi:Flp pilus assembly protein TadG